MLLKEGLSSGIVRTKPVTYGLRRGVSVESTNRFCGCLFSSSAGGDGRAGVGVGRGVDDGDSISFAEAKKLMRLVNVEAMKMKFSTEGKEMISYPELLQACENIGVAKSVDEAKAFAKVLDEAGVVLIFRDKVYLQPEKVQSTILLCI